MELICSFKVDKLKAKAEKKEAGFMSKKCDLERIEAKRAEELGDLKNKVVILTLMYIYCMVIIMFRFLSIVCAKMKAAMGRRTKHIMTTMERTRETLRLPVFVPPSLLWQ